MKRSPLMLSGITRKDRHAVIAEISDRISAAGGWIVHHELYSNLAVMIRFALEPTGLKTWRDSMVETALGLDDDSLRALDQAMAAPAPAGAEITVSLTMTFIHNEPDLRQIIPAVPG
ncbi:hypothetical protein [Pararhodospirillum oryzae]|uniref:Uncharacterized protein n=1 Tax=Pararhodospirillum oryzae TaxID=478448 RepID=A0A512H590_9PROT|nr:hypothetical protein [Pararhodospirillum oryzae]GEO80613.1 hypothetical protein ROR02_07440 [Pararhodospirillum oryzae]